MRYLRILGLTIAFDMLAIWTCADEPLRFYGEPDAIREAKKFVGHEGEVLDALFLPDGSLATAGADGTLRLWDYATGKERQIIARQSQPIMRLMFIPQRGELLSFSADGPISAWQLPAPKRSWGPEQAVGEPNSSSGDQQTAWASATPDEQAEWLVLDYGTPIKVSEIQVFETYNPGAIERITAFLPDGKEVDAWVSEAVEGEAKPAVGAANQPADEVGASRPWAVDEPVQRIKLYLNSPKVEGWNEIDAVGLVDAQGETHWAKTAAASSTYAEHRENRRLVQERERPRLVPPPQFDIPAESVQVTNVDDSAEGKQSYGGTGFAEQFKRPAEAKYVAAIELFGSRYGMLQPPDEDFRVYLLDGDNRVIKELSFPYAMFDRGEECWVVLGVDDVEVPEQFGVAIDFNAHQTKGVYLGKDESVAKTHSYVGTPKSGFKPVEGQFDWMIRVRLIEQPRTPDAKGLRGKI